MVRLLGQPGYSYVDPHSTACSASKRGSCTEPVWSGDSHGQENRRGEEEFCAVYQDPIASTVIGRLRHADRALLNGAASSERWGDRGLRTGIKRRDRRILQRVVGSSRDSPVDEISVIDSVLNYSSDCVGLAIFCATAILRRAAAPFHHDSTRISQPAVSSQTHPPNADRHRG